MDKPSSLSLPLINLTFSLSFASRPTFLLVTAFPLYVVFRLSSLALKPKENLSSAFLAKEKGQEAGQIDAFAFAVEIISGDTRAE